MDVAASAARGASKQVHFCSAAKLYAAAAAQGHRAALRSLGTLFVRGRGVAQDPGEAARLFAYAAGLGDTEAQQLLATVNASSKMYLIEDALVLGPSLDAPPNPTDKERFVQYTFPGLELRLPFR